MSSVKSRTTSLQIMPKRSRNSEDINPLSSARSKSGGGSNTNSNNDQHTSNLWHRKSGAGYKLFIDYYSAQPLGVVVPIDNGVDKHNESAIQNKGMSRAAAKRRRQKQKKKEKKPSSDVKEVNCKREDGISNTESTNTHQQQEYQHKFDVSHTLVQTFNSTTKNNNQHLHMTKFIHALSRPLPLTLRFRQHNIEDDEQHQQSVELKKELATNYSNLIAPVSYDPSNSIYQSTPNSNLSKSNLKKISPKLKELIVEGSMNGTLARQELGSMLPVLSLSACGAMKKGSKVLDLCASPGSKTLQALEIVCGNNTSSSTNKKGRIIANDVHSKRLESLRDAVLRSGMPTSSTSRITYTNFDASVFPLPRSGKLFDAIVCDVPCGGDGTIRKDKFILPMWSPNISNSIHGLQLKILLRALELVKVGGVVCYSTCSLNPVEDEAVVSAAFRNREDDDSETAFELLEWPQDLLPGFIRRPGVTDWKVAYYDQDKESKDDEDDDFGSLSFVDTYDQALSIGMPDIKSTFWPNLTENRRLRLDRCTRLLPQDQDTGGFFVALIKRIR